MWRSTKAHIVPAPRAKTSSRTGTDTVVVVAVDTTSSREKRQRKALKKSPHWTKEWHLFRTKKCFLSSRFERMTGTSEEFVSSEKRRALLWSLTEELSMAWLLTEAEARDTRIVQEYSDTYDLGGDASFSKLDWMAHAMIAGTRRDSQKQHQWIAPLATCRALYSRAVQYSSVLMVHTTSVVLSFEFWLDGWCSYRSRNERLTNAIAPVAARAALHSRALSSSVHSSKHWLQGRRRRAYR